MKKTYAGSTNDTDRPETAKHLFRGLCRTLYSNTFLGDDYSEPNKRSTMFSNDFYCNIAMIYIYDMRKVCLHSFSINIGLCFDNVKLFLSTQHSGRTKADRKYRGAISLFAKLPL